MQLILGLVFDEKTFLDQNLFKYENRLRASTSRFVAEGAVLTSYYSLAENRTTVDKGLQNIDQLFGHNSPLRFNKIKNFPIYGFGAQNPSNEDTLQIEDITVEGECIILPASIVPHQNDFFILNHLSMVALFRVTEVQYDSMKKEGYYKIKYHMYSNSRETIGLLEKQTINTFNTDLNAIGTEVNPVIKEDDFVLRGRIKQILIKMIEGYKALFYNERHNCFLFCDPELGVRLYDFCGSEFMFKHNLMNSVNSSNVIILSDKLNDSQLPIYYNNSVYNWLELGAPLEYLSPFYFNLNYGSNYMISSFAQWSEYDIRVMIPVKSTGENIPKWSLSFFDKKQLNCFFGSVEPVSEFEKLIYRFIHKKDITLRDIPLNIADSLILSVNKRDVFFYVPVVIYIINTILRMN